MTAALTGYGLIAAVLAVLAAFVAAIISGWRHEKQGEAIGAAKKGAEDRAQDILEAAKQGPDALAAEGAKITAELDAELGKRP